MLDAYNGQELAQCWYEAVSRRDGLLVFEQKFGRLPTESEVRASGMGRGFIEYAVSELRDLVVWRWNRDHETLAALGPLVGYRDDARGIVRRVSPPSPDVPTRRPGALRRLLGRLWTLLCRLRLRHRVEEPVLEQRVHEDAGTDGLRRVTNDAEPEPPVSCEGLK